MVLMIFRPQGLLSFQGRRKAEPDAPEAPDEPTEVRAVHEHRTQGTRSGLVKPEVAPVHFPQDTGLLRAVLGDAGGRGSQGRAGARERGRTFGVPARLLPRLPGPRLILGGS